MRCSGCGSLVLGRWSIGASAILAGSRRTRRRPTAWPTATGCPRSAGSSRCSTEAKNASMSRWMILQMGAATMPRFVAQFERSGNSDPDPDA